MENFLFWNKYSFSSCVFFKNIGSDYSLKDYSQKIIKKNSFNSANQRNFDALIINCCNFKLIISYSILSLAS